MEPTPLSNGVNERQARFVDSMKRHRAIPLFERATTYVRGLPPSDKFILSVLSLLVAVISIGSLYALEKSLLVHIPAYGGGLVEGELGSPRFVNPLLAISDADRDLTALLYAGLMGVGTDGTLVPVLAESYDVSEDGKVYTFTLRDSAKFSDGTKVTAADVVFTVQKAQDPALKSPQYANWSGVKVEAVDDRTVRFTLAKPYAPFLEDTTLGILPSYLWEGIPDEQFPFSNLAVEPVGAGPFKVGSVGRDASGLITNYSLTANSNYALGRPYLSGITFTFFSRENDLATALEDGKIESAYGIPQAGALTAPYARIFGVFFNPDQNAVFSKIEVRKALSTALNREDIVQNVLGGYASALMGPVPPGSGIEETVVPSSADPIADAADVLTRNGWKYDGTARAWKNATAKQTLSSLTIKTSNVPELKIVAGAVKTAWEKLGIAVDIELYESGDLNQNVIRPRKYEALLFGMVIGRDEDLYAFWDSSQRTDPGLNIALYANKTVDALLEDARGNGDATKRLADLQKIEDTVAADYPAAFVYAPDFVYAVPGSLRGVVLPQITTPSDRFAGVAEWYRQSQSVWPIFARKN